MCHETDPEETRAIVKEHQQVVQEGNETLKGTLNQSDEATDEQVSGLILQNSNYCMSSGL